MDKIKFENPFKGWLKKYRARKAAQTKALKAITPDSVYKINGQTMYGFNRKK